MCGIVAATAKRDVTKLLIDGLKKLEYRGYDSAGIAILDKVDSLKRIRAAGKVQELQHALSSNPISGTLGIAHTRWATHGAPSLKNAHPFFSNDEFAIVHNGIIENHAMLRGELFTNGYQLQSETDTEVIVHLIHHHYAKSNDFLSAVQKTIEKLSGAYALAIISKHCPNRIIAVRRGSPLVVGCGKNENFIASDPLALLSITQEFIYLEEDDLVDVSPETITIYDKNNELTERKINLLSAQLDATDLGEYPHYMLKEIMEQPESIATCLEGRIAHNRVLPGIFGPAAENIFSKIEHIQFIACGTSYHACMVARYWIESLIGIPCSVEIASEYRYRHPAASKNSLFVALSQSGETADTLAALRLAKTMSYLHTLALCNVPESSMTREAASHFLTRAGIEIGVASTKAFMTQLMSLLLLTLSIAKTKNGLDNEEEIIKAVIELPVLLQSLLKNKVSINQWAEAFKEKYFAIFIGRGTLFPIALEAALKMKEISYIHAEGYPAGELKHGPLALVDSNMPVIACAPKDTLFEKTISNLEEIYARGGELFVLTDDDTLAQQTTFTKAHIINMPSTHPILTPLLYTVPLQLLAYDVAVLKGTDVDQPRNLAKSVTVE